VAVAELLQWAAAQGLQVPPGPPEDSGRG